MSNQDGLPNHWKWVKLGDYAEMCLGKMLDKSKNKGDFQPYLRNINVRWGGFALDDLEQMRFENDEAERYGIKKGDLIVCEGGEPGRCAVWNEASPNMKIQKALHRVRVNAELNVRYLFHYFSFSAKSGLLEQYFTGTTIKHLTGKELRKFEFPLPPLTEQQHIVAKLEELFSELDAGLASLKTAAQQLKTYRQAVLKWAFEGKLTNDHVNEGELPAGWKWVKLGEVSSSVEYGSAAKSKEAGKVPVLRMGNIQNGRFDWKDLVYTDDNAEIEKYLLKKNDVLFNRTNSAELVGKTAIYKGERPAIFAGYLIRINRIGSLIEADYLTYFLNSHTARNYGSTVKSFGVNQSNINGTKLKTYPIPLCSLEEQHCIVQEIESRLSVCDKLEETIAASLGQAEALRQSILKQAFAGKLVAPILNPDGIPA